MRNSNVVSVEKLPFFIHGQAITDQTAEDNVGVGQRLQFISRDLDLWAYHKGNVLDFSRPGKPTDNSYIESFNGKLRAECLNAHWFMTLVDARAKMEDWRREYNEFRPHSAIGNKVPISLMDSSSAHPPN